MKIPVNLLLCAGLLLSGCADLRRSLGASAGADHDVLTGGPVTGITLKELPRPVRRSLETEEPGAEVADIQKRRLNGRVVYEISFNHWRKHPVLGIAENGEVLARIEPQPPETQ
jgi:hypothetical protein